MTIKVKHIGLILGLLLVIISFLFFGRQQEIYGLLLFGGLLISLIFYLAILFSKETTKSKLIWTLVIILAATVQWLTEPLLIKSSYLLYIKNNKIELAEVNNILLNKSGDIIILNDNIDDKKRQLTQTERDKLIKLRKKLNVYMITKSDSSIYYGLWGFLDIRLGVSYLTKNNNPDDRYQLLTGKWYH